MEIIALKLGNLEFDARVVRSYVHNDGRDVPCDATNAFLPVCTVRGFLFVRAAYCLLHLPGLQSSALIQRVRLQLTSLSLEILQ